MCILYINVVEVVYYYKKYIVNNTSILEKLLLCKYMFNGKYINRICLLKI
jgi:hypothetical protein